ncbi:hypothetical protein CONLIGDRAFT_637602 [Coniochaeta ligniaria NRRL 30616]|uniref:RAD52 homolog n=1 Tax=Coniochaeta ligniaria NRRL 30616 TaxID=1408157 RepID=A0A1J7I804_9PEZI|nr:hypothetical protein CONLIGDRAFT_637602 [Coniochaeta ligniaria NRRL 30616]
MPAPGQQHASIANPFEEPKQRVSEYTAQEIASLQSRLEKQLGPEYISSRAGPGGQKVHYVAAEKCIALANEVFGFNGWSSSIQNIQVDFVEEHPTTLKISLGLSVIVRVTLRDGTFHEDIGYGHIENCKGKAAAFEKAKKEGTTDALKRALRSFGNVLGNCIYDKSYLAKVTKMKVEPTKFDEGGLHRHQDFIKKEAVEAAKKADAESQAQSIDSFDDIFAEFDEVDFNVAEDDAHPDEVVLTSTVQSNSDGKTQNQLAVNTSAMNPPSRPLARASSGGSTYNRGPQTPNQQQNSRPNQFNGVQLNGAQNQTHQQGQRPPAQQFNQNRPQQQHNNISHSNNNHNNNSNNNHSSNSSTANSSGSSHHTPQQAHNTSMGAGTGAPPGAGATGFFSARAVKEIPEDALATGATLAPQAGQVFNPRAESPSIRKTPGIDHTKSKPLARNGVHVAPPSTQEAAAGGSTGTSTTGTAAGAFSRPVPQQQARPGNVVNPHFDAARRIGAPGGPGSPLANRGQYRPPTMVNKRPLEGSAGGVVQGRAPLADVSNSAGGAVAMGISGPDVKRLKMG